MGPNGSGKSTLSYVLAGKPDYEVTARRGAVRRREPARPGARRARRQGRVPRVPVSARNPRRRHHDVPASAALNAQRKTRGEAELSTPDFMRAVRDVGAELEIDPEMLQPPRQCRLFRRREEAQRDPADGAARAAARACSTRPIPASTSTRCGSSPTASTRCARPSASILVITHYQRLLELHRARRRARACPRAASSGPAARSWRSNSSATAIANTPTRRRERADDRRAAPSPEPPPSSALAEQFARAAGRGGLAARAPRRSPLRARACRHRRVEAWKYTDLRAAAARRRAARRAARRGGDRRGAQDRLAELPRARRRRGWCFVDGVFVAALSDPPPAGVDARARRRASPALAGRRSDAGAQRRADAGDGVAATVAPGATPPAARDRPLLRRRAAARGLFAPRHRRRRRARAPLRRTLRRRDGPTTQRHRLDRARRRGRRRARPCRGDRGRRRACMSRARSCGSPSARRSTPSPSSPAARWCAIRSSSASTASGRASACRPRPARRTPARRHDAGGRSMPRRAARAANCSANRRRRGDRRVPGQIIVAAGRAEDRRRDDDAGDAAVADGAEADNKPELEIFADDVRCGHGATAGALDAELNILSDGARHSAGGSRGAADPGVRRRGDRAHRPCRLREALLALTRDWLATRAREAA